MAKSLQNSIRQKKSKTTLRKLNHVCHSITCPGPRHRPRMASGGVGAPVGVCPKSLPCLETDVPPLGRGPFRHPKPQRFSRLTDYRNNNILSFTPPYSSQSGTGRKSPREDVQSPSLWHLHYEGVDHHTHSKKLNLPPPLTLPSPCLPPSLSPAHPTITTRGPFPFWGLGRGWGQWSGGGGG